MVRHFIPQLQSSTLAQCHLICLQNIIRGSIVLEWSQYNLDTNLLLLSLLVSFTEGSEHLSGIDRPAICIFVFEVAKRTQRQKEKRSNNARLSGHSQNVLNFLITLSIVMACVWAGHCCQ